MRSRATRAPAYSDRLCIRSAGSTPDAAWAIRQTDQRRLRSSGPRTGRYQSLSSPCHQRLLQPNGWSSATRQRPRPRCSAAPLGRGLLNSLLMRLARLPSVRRDAGSRRWHAASHHRNAEAGRAHRLSAILSKQRTKAIDDFSRYLDLARELTEINHLESTSSVSRRHKFSETITVCRRTYFRMFLNIYFFGLFHSRDSKMAWRLLRRCRRRVRR